MPRQESNSQTRQRSRPHSACVLCKERRVKCDCGSPCTACIKYGTSDTCTYVGRPSRKVVGVLGQSSGIVKTPFQHTLLSSGAIVEEGGTTQNDSDRVKKPLYLFPGFVDRILESSNYSNDDDDDDDGDCTSLSPYPSSSLSDVAQVIHSAQSDLPTVERIQSLLRFFSDQLDWMYQIYDMDSMDPWLLPFLDCMKGMQSSSYSLRKLDATKLALIFAYILASVQVADKSMVKVFFLGCERSDDSLKSKASIGLTLLGIKSLYETHLCSLLDMAVKHDGATMDLIRANLVYLFYLKNQGQHEEEKVATLIKVISKMVKETNLYLDPPSSLSEAKRESHRRLFWTFYIYERIVSASFGSSVTIREEDITTREVKEEHTSAITGRKVNFCLIYRARLSRFIQKFLEKMSFQQFGPSEVFETEIFLENWVNSLPASLDLSLPRLDSILQNSNFDLERHLLHMSYYAIRQALHRTCFFPGKSITVDQMSHSRQICADSALAMIKLQESLRKRLVSDHHLRCLYIPLFTLEASVTLALVSLLGLESMPVHDKTLYTSKDYLIWACRGHDLLLTSPADFGPAIQASKLLSRVLSKCVQIVQLHDHEGARSTGGAKLGLKGILTDEDGKTESFQWLANHGDERTFQYPGSTFPFDTEKESWTEINKDQDLVNMESYELSASAYADLGLLFFDNLPGPIQTQNNDETPPSSDQATAMTGQNFEDQMDAWLETLQGIV